MPRPGHRRTAPWTAGALLAFAATFALTTPEARSQPTPCAFGVDAGGWSFDHTSTTAMLALTTSPGCAWTATSDAAWLTVTSASSGTGPAAISFSLDANAGASRAATLSVGGQLVTILQAGPGGLFTRYFAEGATGRLFQTRLALANPGQTDVAVLLTFLKGDASQLRTAVTVGAHARATVDVQDVPGMEAAEFSTIIEATDTIVADRTMSWDASGYGGHTETAIAAPAMRWYLAEGATHSGFQLYYLVQNPGSTDADLQVTYLRPPPAAPLIRVHTIPAHSRANIYVNAEDPALASTDVSAILDVTNAVPVIVERAMYLDTGGQLFGSGAASAGVTQPSRTWFLAEGATGSFFDLFVLIANPNGAAADLVVTYSMPDGRQIVTTRQVPASSRVTIWVDTEDARLASTAVSTSVRSSLPVIVERSMWWPGPSATTWHEGHNSPGATITGTRWVIADVERGGPRSADTYLLVANTSARPGQARVTLLFEDGTTSTQVYPLLPTSRLNVHPGDDGEFPEAMGRRCSAIIDSLGSPPADLVVERGMYWNANGTTWAAGTNALGTAIAGNTPLIASFAASAPAIPSGAGSTLTWQIEGADTWTIDHGVGSAPASPVTVTPLVTTTYTLTATNAWGTSTASVTITVGAAPVIASFSATPSHVSAGQSSTLAWVVTGATSLSIDQGVGSVAGTSVAVSPAHTTSYTLTATNAFGSVTASLTVTCLPLATIDPGLFYTEHVLFIIPPADRVTWTGSNYASVYAAPNVDHYINTLKTVFPADYFFVVIAAANLTPPNVPNVITVRHLADGIGQNSVNGVGVPNYTRYHLGTGTVIDGAFAVLDHEIGHNWGVNIGAEVGIGHWLSNSNLSGQMASIYSDDGGVTVKRIAGDPVSGFTWSAIDNLTRNETETFSDQDLYLMGLAPRFPDTYVLSSPVYNGDHTVSYSSVTKYDQAWVEGRNGVRSPTYQASDKRLRMGAVYVARDLAEVMAVYEPIERSMAHFVDAEQIDTVVHRFQVPFLVATKFRASLDARLADLDANASPTVGFSGPAYVVAAGGQATIPFSASDADGPTPTVSCVPTSGSCAIVGSTAVLSGLAAGTHFVTIKAQDAGGKKAFAHVVVDVP